MSKLGGYKIVDLSGTAFATGVESTKPGVYESIKSTNKRTVVSGLVMDSVEYDDMDVPFIVEDSNYVGHVILTAKKTLDFKVTSADKVTVTLTVSGV